jgi:hypothetical protein
MLRKSYDIFHKLVVTGVLKKKKRSDTTTADFMQDQLEKLYVIHFRIKK